MSKADDRAAEHKAEVAEAKAEAKEAKAEAKAAAAASATTRYRVLKEIDKDGIVYVPADAPQRHTALTPQHTGEDTSGFIELTAAEAASFIYGEIGPTSMPAEEKV